MNIEFISLNEDGSYNQDKNSIGPENQTKDSICNDDKPDTFTSNFTTERNIIPPTPWVRPKTSLTSGRQKQLLDSGRATEIETILGGDVTRASLDETVDPFSEPSQSEEEASSQQAWTGPSAQRMGIENPKTSKTLMYAQQIAKKSGLPTFKCSIVIIRSQKTGLSLTGKPTQNVQSGSEKVMVLWKPEGPPEEDL